MNLDNELDAWQRQWQGAPVETGIVSAANLRQRVERESRRMKIGLLAPAIITIAIGGAVLLRALGSVQTPDLILAIGVWISILIAWAGSLGFAHGTWRPLGETTAAYVDVSIRRCRSSTRTAKFGAGLYVAQFVFVVLWKLRFSGLGASAVLTAWPVVVLGWIGFPLFLVWLSWYLRVKRAELAALLGLREQIDGAC